MATEQGSIETFDKVIQLSVDLNQSFLISAKFQNKEIIKKMSSS